MVLRKMVVVVCPAKGLAIKAIKIPTTWSNLGSKKLDLTLVWFGFYMTTFVW